MTKGLLIKAPVEQTVRLKLSTELDPDQTAQVKVRPATTYEQARRAQVGAEVSRIYRDGSKEVEIKYDWTYEQQQRAEVYLTLAEFDVDVPANDPSDVDKTVKLFRFKRDNQNRLRLDMTDQEFEIAWGLLPEVVTAEVHRAVLEVNPQWDPKFRASSSDN